MINSKEEYIEYLNQDKRALGINRYNTHIIGDDIWKFERSLRLVEYLINCKPVAFRIRLMIARLIKYRLGIRCGFSIPPNVFDKGLCIVHYGTIVVSPGARIGKNCRIHEGVTIGSTNHSEKAAVIGNNCFIGSGAKIIGDIKIADDIQIGAGSVVVHNILESSITVGGIPAKKISNNSSKMNLPIGLFEKAE